MSVTSSSDTISAIFYDPLETFISIAAVKKENVTLPKNRQIIKERFDNRFSLHVSVVDCGLHQVLDCLQGHTWLTNFFGFGLIPGSTIFFPTELRTEFVFKLTSCYPIYAELEYELWKISLCCPGVCVFRGFLNISIQEILKSKNLRNESLNVLPKNYYSEILAAAFFNFSLALQSLLQQTDL